MESTLWSPGKISRGAPLRGSLGSLNALNSMSGHLVRLGIPESMAIMAAHISAAFSDWMIVGSPTSSGLSHHSKYINRAHTAWANVLSSSRLMPRPWLRRVTHWMQNHDACKHTMVLAMPFALL